MAAVPGGKSTVTPYVVAKGAKRLLEFIAEGLSGEVYLSVPNPDGTIGHAEARIGSSVVMVFDSQPEWPFSPSFLSIYVDDVDETVRRAVSAGAEIVTEVMSSGVSGDRGGRLRDPVGNIWWIQTHEHDVTTEQMQAAFADPQELATMKRAQDSFDEIMRSIG